MRAKEAALTACEPPVPDDGDRRRREAWRSDEKFLAWLSSL
jgi:hypothetical protein